MIKKIVLFMVFSVIAFSFEISDIRFDEEIKKGEKSSKEFTIYNSGEKEIIYRLAIEGDKNVKVKPNLLRIKKLEREKFKVEVIGKKNGGEQQYYLVVKEMKTPKEVEGEGVELLKTIKILQKYKIK